MAPPSLLLVDLSHLSQGKKIQFWGKHPDTWRKPTNAPSLVVKSKNQLLVQANANFVGFLAMKNRDEDPKKNGGKQKKKEQE